MEIAHPIFYKEKITPRVPEASFSAGWKLPAREEDKLVRKNTNSGTGFRRESRNL